MKSVTVGSSVDSSSKLQTLINNTGNTPTEYVFSENNVEINSTVKFYNNAKLTGNGVNLHLKDKVSESVFPTMTPILTSKTSPGAINLEFTGITFDGNYNNQTVSLGKAYHNFIYIYKGTGIKVHDCYIHDTAGDGARLTYCKNSDFYNNRVVRPGHEGVYFDGGSDAHAWGNYGEIRTNNLVRVRHITRAHVHDNKIYNKVAGAASCPGIQIEVSTEQGTLSDVLIEDNYLEGVYGPGIWAMGRLNTSMDAAKGVIIRNNTFYKCGQMKHIAGVGGIVCDGINDIEIYNNLFDSCNGYGVMFGSYVAVTSASSGYKALVRDNVFKNTGKSITAGEASGTALCNLIPKKYTVEAWGNSYSGNVQDRYNVTEQVKTPEEPDRPAYVKFECPESEIDGLKEKYELYKRLNNE